MHCMSFSPVVTSFVMSMFAFCFSVVSLFLIVVARFLLTFLNM